MHQGVAPNRCGTGKGGICKYDLFRVWNYNFRVIFNDLNPSLYRVYPYDSRSIKYVLGIFEGRIAMLPVKRFGNGKWPQTV